LTAIEVRGIFASGWSRGSPHFIEHETIPQDLIAK